MAKLKLNEDKNPRDMNAYLIDKFVLKENKKYERQKTLLKLFVNENLPIVDEKVQFFDCDDLDERVGEYFDEPQPPQNLKKC